MFKNKDLIEKYLCKILYISPLLIFFYIEI